MGIDRRGPKVGVRLVRLVTAAAVPLLGVAACSGTPSMPSTPTTVRVASVFTGTSNPDAWPVRCDDSGCRKVEDGGYVVEMTPKHMMIARPRAFDLTELRKVTLGVTIDSVTGDGDPFIGLACMTTHQSGAGFPVAYYDLSITSKGVLSFYRYADGQGTGVLEPVAAVGFDQSAPGSLTFTCETTAEGVKLTADLAGQAFSALDATPLPAGGAALLVSNDKDAPARVRFSAITLDAEVRR